MAIGKEIRTKIASVNSTRKITSAMELVAASKMRKVQERMQASRPYSDNMLTIIQHLAGANAEYKHPFLSTRDVKNVGVLLISTDRGLCGGLNINLFKKLVQQMAAWQERGVNTQIASIGNKGLAFMRRFGANMVASTSGIGDTPEVADIISVVNVLVQAFEREEIDELYVAHNSFVNTMTQTPTIEQLLPLSAAEGTGDQALPWDYIYEGEVQQLITALLQRYIEALVYQGTVENAACEQAARMVAMKSATDNAGSMIDELQLIYNKARQAAITQELSEIVGGAEAV